MVQFKCLDQLHCMHGGCHNPSFTQGYCWGLGLGLPVVPSSLSVVLVLSVH